MLEWPPRRQFADLLRVSHLHPADAAVTIGPPFRLELLVGGRSIPLQSVETTDSAPTELLGNQTNEFTQLYLESTGQRGDVRVSRVTAGDDVVLNSTFVHVRGKRSRVEAAGYTGRTSLPRRTYEVLLGCFPQP
eukprot:1188480-Prorocentrum_minimum.AAC.2